MWDQVDELVGATREDELKRKYWGPMIDRGASVQRFPYTRESAFAILSPFYTELNRRCPILLQREMNEHGLALRETSAGKTLRVEFEDLVAHIQRVLEEIQRVSKEPAADPEQLSHLIDEYQKAIIRLHRATRDMKKMKVSTGNWIHKFSQLFKFTRLSRFVLTPCILG